MVVRLVDGNVYIELGSLKLEMACISSNQVLQCYPHGSRRKQSGRLGPIFCRLSNWIADEMLFLVDNVTAWSTDADNLL